MDQQLLEAVNRGWHSSALDPVFLIFTYFGSGWVQAVFMLLLIFLTRTRICGFTCLTAWALAGAVTHLGKAYALRDRPGDLAIMPPDEQLFLGSFPSGHAATAFALGFALLLCFPGGRRLHVGYTALFIALGVGLSRVYRGVHWPSDVVAGVALGVLSALAAHALIERIGRVRTRRRA